MAEGLPRVLVDTSVWISAAIRPTGPPGRVLAALREGRLIPVVSRPLLAEIREVLDRPRIRRLRRMGDADLATLLALLDTSAIKAFPTGELRLCRDPQDDFLLETAILGGAQFIVSRDDDLKRDLDLMVRLREYGVEVLTVAQFLHLLATRST